MTVSSHGWLPTRAEGCRRLAAFVPRAGRSYARLRNYDRGPGRHTDVSTLSPWIRHRLLLEQEVLEPVVSAHGFDAAGKFIQEVFWRTYWKGWLELRPSVWIDYRSRVAALRLEIDLDHALRDNWRAATSGRTGIGCFDAWANELIDTGYLHNHARMWFASIWIFTLRLPWELGADFFLRHLLDGDPASNTLSWRWVAGLQTRGKTYLARAANITKYTLGRLNAEDRLAQSAPALTEDPPPLPMTPPQPIAWERDGATGLLVTEEDLQPGFVLEMQPGIEAVAALGATDQRSPFPVAPLVRGFVAGAIADALARIPDRRACLLTSPAAVADWACSAGLRQIVTPYVPVGPTAEALREVSAILADHGVAVIPVLRRWDHVAWPHAKRGFFPFREKIPQIWSEVVKDDRSAA